MKYCFFMLVLTAAAVAGTGCEQVKTKHKPQTNTETKTNREPITDDEPPLLLEDGPDVGQPDGPVADNTRCYVCHMNYIQEDIAVIHARANIGCADCHGDCDAHIADESWAWGENGTPPGIMYPPAKINPFCMGCHPADKIDTEQHKPLFAGTGEKKYCTDCHGNHRLAHRKCKWK
jgi:hypothetical protein